MMHDFIDFGERFYISLQCFLFYYPFHLYLGVGGMMICEKPLMHLVVVDPPLEFNRSSVLTLMERVFNNADHRGFSKVNHTDEYCRMSVLYCNKTIGQPMCLFTTMGGGGQDSPYMIYRHFRECKTITPLEMTQFLNKSHYIEPLLLFLHSVCQKSPVRLFYVLFSCRREVILFDGFILRKLLNDMS